MSALNKDEIDEGSDFQLGRYIFTNEVMLWIVKINIHKHYPVIITIVLSITQ